MFSWPTAAWVGLVGALLVAGCAVPQFEKLGADRADVIARLGAPTGRYALPDGERLQYSQQPAGTQVYNLDFDAAGKLRSVNQALQTESFFRIAVDQWRVRDVEQLLGKPASVERVARFNGDIWTYRYQDYGGYRRLHVHIDPAGVVRQLMTTDEPTIEQPDFTP